MSFGQRLKYLRTSLGITQEELALKIGIQKQHISRYENDRCEPNIRTAKRIADALGVSLEELSKGAFSPSSTSPAFSPDEVRLVADYRDASDEIREEAAAMLHRSAERNRKESARSSANAG